MERTVLCIKWGTKYGCHYVNRLFHGVMRNVERPVRFVCLTEDSNGIDRKIDVHPLPVTPFDEKAFDARKGGETWRKVGLLQPGLAGLTGDTLFLDLDIVITGSLEPLFDYHAGKFCVIQDWLERRRRWLPGRDGRVGNTSVFRFNPTRHRIAYDRFVADQYKVLDSFRIEQQYMSHALRDDMEFWPSDWVCSFKRNCRPFFPLNHFRTPYQPPDMRILVFHGYPLPDQAIAGFQGGLIKSTLPARWIEDFWGAENDEKSLRAAA